MRLIFAFALFVLTTVGVLLVPYLVASMPTSDDVQIVSILLILLFGAACANLANASNPK